MTPDLISLKNNLEKRKFSVKLFSSKEEVCEYLNREIDGVSVGIGGSVTVKELGLFPFLKTHNEVWWHNDDEQLAAFGDVYIRDKAREAERYISSVNGVSADGRLVNIDGRGNRVASTAYGHKKVYYIVGKNKLADSLEQAIWRARNIASPKNARRLGLKTPCAVKADRCYDCSSPQRICRGILITEAPMLGQETEILLVDEVLGY